MDPSDEREGMLTSRRVEISDGNVEVEGLDPFPDVVAHVTYTIGETVHQFHIWVTSLCFG